MSPSRGLLQPCRLGMSALSRARPQVQPRQTALRTSQRRCFGESIVESVYLGLSSVHNVTNLPWYAILPLTALTIRMGIVLPLQVVAAKNQRKRLELRPLVLNARPQLQDKIMAEHAHEGPEKCTRRLSRALEKETRKVEREAGVSRWPGSLPLLQLPVWFVVIETIRRMCGERVGLLGLVMGWADTSEQCHDATDSSTPLPQGTQAASHLTNHTSIEGVSLTNNSDSAVSTIWQNMFESSLSLEGCLWFPNLLAPDPQLILPFALSATMFTSIWMEERKVKLAGRERSRGNRIFTNALKLVALVVGPLTLNMPAAIHVYWISSGLIALPQKGLVDYLAPVPNPEAYVAEKPTVDRPIMVNGAPMKQHKKKYVPLRNAKGR